MKIVKFRPRDAVRSPLVQLLEEALQMAKSGEITDAVLILRHREDQAVEATWCAPTWREHEMCGALMWGANKIANMESY